MPIDARTWLQAVVADARIRHSTRVVAHHIADRLGPDGVARISVPGLMQACNFDERRVRLALKNLRRYGWLLTTRQGAFLQHRPLMSMSAASHQVRPEAAA